MPECVEKMFQVIKHGCQESRKGCNAVMQVCIYEGHARPTELRCGAGSCFPAGSEIWQIKFEVFRPLQLLTIGQSKNLCRLHWRLICANCYYRIWPNCWLCSVCWPPSSPPSSNYGRRLGCIIGLGHGEWHGIQGWGNYVIWSARHVFP